MNITFTRTNPAYALKHPANIEAGDIFTDTNADGATVSVLALRNAARLRRHPAYRVYGLDLTNNVMRTYRFEETRNVTITGVVPEISIDTIGADNTNGMDDPMISERDAAQEAIDTDSPIQPDTDEEFTEDA